MVGLPTTVKDHIASVRSSEKALELIKLRAAKLAVPPAPVEDEAAIRDRIMKEIEQKQKEEAAAKAEERKKLLAQKRAAQPPSVASTITTENAISVSQRWLNMATAEVNKAKLLKASLKSNRKASVVVDDMEQHMQQITALQAEVTGLLDDAPNTNDGVASLRAVIQKGTELIGFLRADAKSGTEGSNRSPKVDDQNCNARGRTTLRRLWRLAKCYKLQIQCIVLC